MHAGRGEPSNPHSAFAHRALVYDSDEAFDDGFTLQDLPIIRRVAESAAADAGLPAERVGDVVIAVNEIATNAVVHGHPPARFRVWNGEGELVFEVSDAGEGIDDVPAIRLRPLARDAGGLGLWLAMQLSDAIEIRNGSGSAVAVHANTPAAEPG